MPVGLASLVEVRQGVCVPRLRTFLSAGRFVALAAAGGALVLSLQFYTRTGWAGGWLIVSCLLTMAASLMSLVLRRTSARVEDR